MCSTHTPGVCRLKQTGDCTRLENVRALKSLVDSSSTAGDALHRRNNTILPTSKKPVMEGENWKVISGHTIQLNENEEVIGIYCHTGKHFGVKCLHDAAANIE